MIKYEGMKSEQNVQGGYPMLPEGPYIAKVSNVKIDGSAPDQTLVIRLDVVEGEYKDYFTNRYKADAQNANSQFPAKYKGDYRLRIPNRENANDQWPETTVRRFNGAIWCFEESNPGFHFDGDENKLIGKLVGINMRLSTFNDKEFTKIGRLESVEAIKNGLVKPMKPGKPAYSADYQPTTSQDAETGFTVVEDTAVPF